MEEFKGIHLNYYDALCSNIQTMQISRDNIDSKLVNQIDKIDEINDQIKLCENKIQDLEKQNILYAERIQDLIHGQKVLKQDIVGYLKGLNSEIEDLKRKANEKIC